MLPMTATDSLTDGPPPGIGPASMSGIEIKGDPTAAVPAGDPRPAVSPGPAPEPGSDEPRTATVEVVVPVYDEEATLERSIRRLHSYLAARFPLSWQITIADNASTDRTWDLARDLARELDGVTAVHLDQKGRGRALRQTWSMSDAIVVAYMDVDLSTDLDALLPLVAPLVSGHSDVAIGTRLGSGARVVRGPKREAISRAYNLILHAALRSGFSDAQCGFKAMRADVARRLLPLVEDQNWFFDTEVLVLAERNGLRVHEVPVDWVDDADTRVHVTSTALEDLRGIWRLLRRFARGQGVLPDALAAADPAGASDGDGDPDLPDPTLVSQLVRFASIGAVSTVLFAVLFAVLAGPLGPVLADVVALAICSLANLTANRRLTFSLRGRTHRVRHYSAGLALTLLPLATTLATLGLLSLAGLTSLTAQLIALSLANGLATAARFVVLRQWIFR